MYRVFAIFDINIINGEICPPKSEQCQFNYTSPCKVNQIVRSIACFQQNTSQETPVFYVFLREISFSSNILLNTRY